MIFTKLTVSYKLFRFTKNPLSIVWNYLTKGRAKAITKEGKSILVQKHRLSPTALVNLLAAGWKIKYLAKEKCYLFSNGSILLKGPNGSGLGEDLEKNYLRENIQGKVVLDVGGFLGETTVYFIKKGKASKVLVFEPVPEHTVYIKKNIELNNIGNKVRCTNMVSVKLTPKKEYTQKARCIPSDLV